MGKKNILLALAATLFAGSAAAQLTVRFHATR
jgi:hypothetical protein